MLRQLVGNKRLSSSSRDKVDHLIGQVRAMSLRQDQIRIDLEESLRHAEEVLQRCERYRKQAD
jgi:hypothetical protein